MRYNRTGQSCNNRRELQRGDLGAEPPATEGKRGFEGGAPDAEEIFAVFSKKYAFLSILWSKFHLKHF